MRRGGAARKMAGGAVLIVAALLLLSPSPARAQWCSYPNYAPGTRCDVPLETLPPPPPGDNTCVVTSFDLALGTSWEGEIGGCVGMAGYGCCAWANADLDTGSTAFSAALRVCLLSCTLDAFIAPPPYSLPYASASAGASCNWPHIPIPTGICETASEARDAFEWFSERAVRDINYFIQELTKFIDLNVNMAATAEVLTRLAEYDRNLYPPLNQWWDDGNDYCDGVLSQDTINSIRDDVNAGNTSPPGGGWWWDTSNHCSSTLPALKAMMTEVSVARVLQTMQIGLMLDSKAMNEKIRDRQQAEAEAVKRYVPGESSCQLDMAGTARTKAYQMSLGFTFAMTREDTLRRNNHIELPPATADASGNGLFVRKAHAVAGSPLQPVANGRAQQIATLWDEYVRRFCNPDRGDQGCDPADAADFPGMNTNLPDMLWEGNGTVDLNDGTGDNITNAQAMLRTLITPFAPPPIPPGALNTAQGREEMMRRRARDARLNCVYNVMAQLVSQRFSGSGASMNDIRTAAGLPEDTSDHPINATETANGQPGGGASLAAIREAMAKTQYFDPLFVIRLVNDETAVTRDQNAVDVTINETTNDLYRRMEESLFMEACNFSDDLDKTYARSE